MFKKIVLCTVWYNFRSEIEQILYIKVSWSLVSGVNFGVPLYNRIPEIGTSLESDKSYSVHIKLVLLHPEIDEPPNRTKIF